MRYIRLICTKTLGIGSLDRQILCRWRYKVSTCAVAFLIHRELLIIDELSFLDVEDRGVVCECGQRRRTQTWQLCDFTCRTLIAPWKCTIVAAIHSATPTSNRLKMPPNNKRVEAACRQCHWKNSRRTWQCDVWDESYEEWDAHWSTIYETENVSMRSKRKPNRSLELATSFISRRLR